MHFLQGNLKFVAESIDETVLSTTRNVEDWNIGAITLFEPVANSKPIWYYWSKAGAIRQRTRAQTPRFGSNKCRVGK